MTESTRRNRYLLAPHTDLLTQESTDPQIITRGQGIYVFDEHGKRYIEGVAGLWCTTLGFSNERLIAAALRQLRRLPYYSSFNNRTHDVVLALAEKLVAMVPVEMSRVLFANSGSEANDSALKIAWYYNNALGRPSKKKILAHDRGYHGSTIATAGLTGLTHMHRGFDLPQSTVVHIPSPYYYRAAADGESEEAFAGRMAEQLEATLMREDPQTVAAFITEPVMGAGGLIVPHPLYFAKLQQLLSRHDILLIADEVITGFGRTGCMFGTQLFDLRPDMITVAKGLSSAYMPISALLINERVYSALRRGCAEQESFAHGFTYSGHPVCAAVALEALSIYEEGNFLGQVQRLAEVLHAHLNPLREHPLVGDIRCCGLLAGVELVLDKVRRTAFPASARIGARVVARAQHHGVILRAMGDTVVFAPPLIIDEAALQEVVAGFSRALDDIYAADGAAATLGSQAWESGRTAASRQV